MITVFEIISGGARLLVGYTLDEAPRIGSTLVDEDARVLEVRSMHSVPSALGDSHIVLHVSAERTRAHANGSISHRSGLASKTDVPDKRSNGAQPAKRSRFLGEKVGR